MLWGATSVVVVVLLFLERLKIVGSVKKSKDGCDDQNQKNFGFKKKILQGSFNKEVVQVEE